MENYQNGSSEDAYSMRVKAGKRTYFFDVKATRAEDFYITITESKKKTTGYGVEYEKHKIFVYKEDFLKFAQGLESALAHAKQLMPDYDFTAGPSGRDEEPVPVSRWSGNE